MKEPEAAKPRLLGTCQAVATTAIEQRNASNVTQFAHWQSDACPLTASLAPMCRSCTGLTNLTNSLACIPTAAD